ncbi:hypothetical protein DL93DRAFT_2086593 [Clavulina sp. PMI_390]|nr:hypothetical protein DL93DRAFT_2086593 [Clavulina sp. PMI_390]
MIGRRMKQPGVPTHTAKSWSSSFDLVTQSNERNSMEVGHTCNASLCEYLEDVKSRCGRCKKVHYCSPECVAV